MSNDTPMQGVTFVRCKICGGEFDDGEWDADTRCPECESPKRADGKRRTPSPGAHPMKDNSGSAKESSMTAAEEHGWKFAIVGDTEGHVFPVGGREHDMHGGCWCRPDAEDDDETVVYTHKMETPS